MGYTSFEGKMALCNSFKSLRAILSESRALKDRLRDHSRYHAHTHASKAPEPLVEHVNLVIDFALDLIDTHHIEPVVDRLIEPLCQQDYVNNPTEFGSFIKKLFINTIVFHDYGKINENFQRERMNNGAFQRNPSNGIGTQHSVLSAFLYVAEHIHDMYTAGKLNETTQAALYALCFWFSNSILKHHASYFENDLTFPEGIVLLLIPYLKVIDSTVDEVFVRASFHLGRADGYDYRNKIEEISRQCFTENCRFPIYTLLKLNFSLLTAADYYATSVYMNDLQSDDFGVISSEDRKIFFQKFKTSKDYNRIFFERPAYFTGYPDERLQSCNPENLNILRQKLLGEVTTSININQDKNIFYLEAPTGSGKTNISLAAALQLIENHPELNKIFYVFPFTTLITQTASSIRETLELTSEQMVAIHARSGFHSKWERQSDGQYGNEKLNYIDNLFVNYPITLLTHIKFFDILKNNGKEPTYLFHRLANSVVIIDELQSYPPRHWDKVAYFLSKFAAYFNIKFVLMSATLPKLDRLSARNVPSIFCPLVKNKNRYFLNPNFRNRVVFDFTLLDQTQTLETLSKFVLNKCEEHARENHGQVKALIEFIYKRSATQFYDAIYQNARDAGFRVLVLSGTILEPRRRRIIELIKSASGRSKINQKILLISTQVVEAGVDIDMDIGFKDRSLIDSDEQLAGRVNRNARPTPATVYIFDLDQTFRVYGDDLRYKITRDHISTDEYQRILKKKAFDELYDKVCERINRENSDEFVRNFDDYKKKIERLEFQRINLDFKLIDQQTVSVFVPLKIPARFFSNDDLAYLRDLGYYRNERAVDGAEIWDAYLDIIYSKNSDFITKKIDLKKIYGIMSQFMFSLALDSRYVRELKRFCNGEYFEKYEIMYLEEWSEVYDYKSGIRDEKFDEAAFL